MPNDENSQKIASGYDKVSSDENVSFEKTFERKTHHNFEQPGQFQDVKVKEQSVRGNEVVQHKNETVQGRGAVERVVVEAIRQVGNGKGHVVLSSTVDKVKITVEAFQVSDKHIVIKVITSDQGLRAEVSRNFDFIKSEAERFGFTVLSFDVSGGGQDTGKDFLQNFLAFERFENFTRGFEENFSQDTAGTEFVKINLKGKLDIIA